MVLRITVKTLDSSDHQFEAQDDWSVSQFKAHIEGTVDVPATEQRLIFCGRVLQNDKKLTEYDCDGKVMHLVQRPPPTVDDQINRDETNNTTRNERPTSANVRVGDVNNLILSAMTFGDGNMNEFVRQMSSFQQALHRTFGAVGTAVPNNPGTGSSQSTDSTNSRNRSQPLTQFNIGGSENQVETVMEGSVTITATTVDTVPLTSTTSTSSGMQPAHATATIVVTSEPSQGGVHIPVSIPIGPINPNDIHFSFSTPQVPPPTQEHSRASSASRQRDSDQPTDNEQQDPNQPQQRQESSSTQTTPTIRPIAFYRMPAPYENFLLCYCPHINPNNQAAQRDQANQPERWPEARIQLRVPRMRISTSVEPFVQQTSAQHTEAGQTTNPTTGPSLTEVATNIIESILRPNDGLTQSTPRAQSETVNISPPNNQPMQTNPDPILSMLPDLAINAVSQILGGLFGLRQPNVGPEAQPQDQSRTRAQNTTMMDIDIDESSGSQSESRYHDASDFMSSQPGDQEQTVFTQRPARISASPSTSRHSTLVAGSSQGSNINQDHLMQVLQNHPEWLPIIEQDIRFMNDQLRDGARSPSYFSDAYLNSVPRKRRRLLAATPDRVFILQSSPSQAIGSLVTRAVTNSNVSTTADQLETFLGEITSDPEIQAAYEDHVKTCIEARLSVDEDFDPDKFTSSGKYYNINRE